MSRKINSNPHLLPLSEQMVFPFDFGDAVKRLVDDKKLTQGYIADRIGLSQGRISQVYGGADSSVVGYNPRSRLFTLCMREGINPYTKPDN